MPQWAGFCWYEVRYLDPANERRFVDPQVERYWMGPTTERPAGGVDLYVGGVEHAVLHLLYARFWQKGLFALGHVSESFARLVNRGYIRASAYVDERGFHVPAAAVVEGPDGFAYEGRPVTREFGKMGKSLKNSVTPDEMYDRYGADTLRLYEMFGGPLEQSRPWDTRAVVGVFGCCSASGASWWTRNWSPEGLRRPGGSGEPTRAASHDHGGERRYGRGAVQPGRRPDHRAEQRPHHSLGATGGAPREIVEPLVLMLAPLAPHLAEELWSLLGHPGSLAREPFPVADPVLLTTESVRLAVQVNGKVRATLHVPADTDDVGLETLTLADERVARALAGAPVRRVTVVRGRLVNVITG